MLPPGQTIEGLVLTPTRELAEQVAKALLSFAKHKPRRIITIYGGVGFTPQIHAIKTASIVVATPGRLLDHLNQRTISLSNVKILVLDEADRMLDMGFLNDVEDIIRQCPKQRQTLLFSATMPSEITRLAHRYMKQPLEIRAEDVVDPTKLTQVCYEVQPAHKFSVLLHLLQTEKSGLVMVFCNTQHYTDRIARELIKHNIRAIAIHGGLSQNQRNRVMQQFHSIKVDVLVCTDVAARGIDVKDVSHVYNYDVPNDPQQYIHRIGRTARAGKLGKAINIVSTTDRGKFRDVLRFSRAHITRMELPHFAVIAQRHEEPRHDRPRGQHGRGGRQFQRRRR